MSSISWSSNRWSPHRSGQRAKWCHTFWQHEKGPKRGTERKVNSFHGFWGAVMMQSWLKLTQYVTPNLAAHNKTLSETFMTFINKSPWLMLALFFGISNKAWHIYTSGQSSQSSIKHVWKDRLPWSTHEHRLAHAKKEINKAKYSSCFSIHFLTSKKTHVQFS